MCVCVCICVSLFCVQRVGQRLTWEQFLSTFLISAMPFNEFQRGNAHMTSSLESVTHYPLDFFPSTAFCHLKCLFAVAALYGSESLESIALAWTSNSSACSWKKKENEVSRRRRTEWINIFLLFVRVDATPNSTPTKCKPTVGYFVCPKQRIMNANYCYYSLHSTYRSSATYSLLDIAFNTIYEYREKICLNKQLKLTV